MKKDWKEKFSKARDYDKQADLIKNEFFNKFSKEEMFELMLAYRTIVKYFSYELIHPNNKEKALELLKTAEQVAVLSARERTEKDGKIKKNRNDLEKLEKNTNKNLN